MRIYVKPVVLSAGILFYFHTTVSAQRPAFSKKKPPEASAIRYKLTVDSNDLSRYGVTMQLNNITGAFKVAMVTHPEYDDRFYRYVKNIRVESSSNQASVTRADSAVWNISGTGPTATISYDIVLPPSRSGPRPSWQPFLSPTGGMVGDLHSFMYVPGRIADQCMIDMVLPRGWQVATSLKIANNPYQFIADSAEEVADAPFLMGKLQTTSFSVDDIPHRISYLSPSQQSIDMPKLSAAIKKTVVSARNLFGRLPYPSYDFLLRDDAYGGLEHANCVMLGAEADHLTKDPTEFLAEFAHEYFHSWNLVRIKPAEWKSISYKTPELSKVLWWSEGLTLYYSDLLIRRAGLPTHDSSRILHLTNILQSYFSNLGNIEHSAEKVSLSANGPNGMLGDYTASAHTQGEILGTLLDLIIRDKTNGKRTIDDVMRKLMKDFGEKKGIRSKDIANAIRDVSGYDASLFFKNHIYGNSPPDIDRYLAVIGHQMILEWQDAKDAIGNLQPDNRLFVWQDPGSTPYRIQMFDPESCWVKAGIHTGDTVIAVNDRQLTGNRELFNLFRTLKTGDPVKVTLYRNRQVREVVVNLSGFKIPKVTLRKLTEVNPKQERLYSQWAAAK